MKNSYPDHTKVEVLQHLQKVGSIAKTSREFGIHPSTVYAWKCIGIQKLQRRLPQQATCSATSNDQSLTDRLNFLEKENAVLRAAAKLYLSC